MVIRTLKLIAVLSFTLQLAACGPPLPLPYLSKDVSYVTVSEIETLVDKSASRKRVIEILGRPLRYREREIYYEVCRKEGGVYIVAGTGDPRKLACNELILEFDKQDILRGFRKTSRKWQLDEQAEDMNLRALGKNGDIIAQQLWEKSRTYYMSQQIDIVDERNANERRHVIAKTELASNLKNRAEHGDAESQFDLYLLEDKTDLNWLCRAADQGYTRAEIWLGHALETGTYGFPIDYMRSYFWYRRAAIGEHKQDIDKTVEKIKKKSPEHYYCIGGSCYLAQKIVDLEGKLDTEEVSRVDNLLEQWEPGICEREFSRIESGE